MSGESVVRVDFFFNEFTGSPSSQMSLGKYANFYEVSFRELAFLWLNQPNSSERIYRFEPGKTENKKHQNDSFLLS